MPNSHHKLTEFVIIIILLIKINIIINPVISASGEYRASQKISEPLKDMIVQQSESFSDVASFIYEKNCSKEQHLEI